MFIRDKPTFNCLLPFLKLRYTLQSSTPHPQLPHPKPTCPPPLSPSGRTWHAGDTEQVGRADRERLQHVGRVVGVDHSHLAGVVRARADPHQRGEALVQRLALRADLLLLLIGRNKRMGEINAQTESGPRKLLDI